MQYAAPPLALHFDTSVVESAARRSAARARALINRAACDDQQNALSVAALQFDSAARHLHRGDIDQARESLRAACNYAASEEANAPHLASAARTLLATIPA
ncbi:hypothetical protein [Streptomyces sp. NPDC059378]|uniref:hypothetical protein n=1 Tax=Streptomyces sp. NPDC059378 TaxID=3346815 RepID=UPI00368B3CE4